MRSWRTIDPVAPSAASFDATSAMQQPGQREHLVSGVRRCLAGLFWFVSLFLFVRFFFLEPFGVPTGSMATTLYGNHRELDCPRCGFSVVLGEPSSLNGRMLADAVCPNCGQTRLNFTSARELPGDRLLVDKNVFNLRTPRRWEVAVFRCPVDDTKPYVKRVVGLPGEAIQLRDGDAWANGELLRKTLPQCRECWAVVFDHRFAPPGGWGNRWLVESLHEPGANPKPAGPEVLQNGSIVLTSGTGLTYRHWNLNAEREDPITDWLAYNGTGSERGRQLVHDFAVVFDLEVQSGVGSFA